MHDLNWGHRPTSFFATVSSNPLSWLAPKLETRSLVTFLRRELNTMTNVQIMFLSKYFSKREIAVNKSIFHFCS